MTDLKRITDEKEVLGVLKRERQNARGFDGGDELSDERIRAYDYYNGKVTDLDHERGRSKAVSSDVSDTTLALMPDLMEIFASGESVVEFSPVGEEDEEAAQQETDFVNHVFWDQNNGFMILYDAIMDGLLAKTSLLRWSWREKEEELEFKNQSPQEFANIVQRAQQDPSFEVTGTQIRIDGKKFDPKSLAEDGVLPSGEQKVNVTATEKNEGVEIYSVAPEDFGIDRNATTIKGAGLTVERQRIRAFELKEQGINEELVDSLKEMPDDPSVKMDREARSTFDDNFGADELKNESRVVEVHWYHSHMDADGDGVKLWSIRTGNNDTVLLDAEVVESIPYSAGSPYPTPHEFYGRSLADLVVEIQKINTALDRLVLDDTYYTINPRPLLNELEQTEHTWNDLLDNRPGKPIRVNGPTGVSWPQKQSAAEAGLRMKEAKTADREEATGVGRATQGLNPDSLHDTASGANALMSRMQARMKMLARILSETVIKDLFLGVHDFLQLHSTIEQKVRLRGEWISIDPNKWGRRKDMRVSVGLGSNTKQQELIFLNGFLEKQIQAISLQGGVQGPLVNLRHIYNTTKQLLKAGGFSNVDAFIQDPDQLTDEQRAELESQQNQPDPEVLKNQQEIAFEQFKFEKEHELDVSKAQAETQIAVMQTFLNAGLKEEALAQQREIELLRIETDSDTKIASSAINMAGKLNGAQDRVRFGGRVG